MDVDIFWFNFCNSFKGNLNMDQEEESTAEVEKVRKDCLGTAALMLTIADKVSEEDLPQHSREKMRKVRALI